MRPLLSVSDGITSRGARHGESSTPSAPPPMACFLTTEADLETAGDESGPSCHAQSVVPKRTVETVRRRTHDQHQSPRPASLSSAAASSSSSSSSSVSSFAPSVALGQTMSHGAQPLASLLAGLSEPESAISTSSSRRNSLLTASSFEYQDSYPASAAVISRSDTPHLDSLSSPGPQLIMPSLNVPRRRPFSDAGKSIGKLKLLVAGQSGMEDLSVCFHVRFIYTDHRNRNRQDLTDPIHGPRLRTYCAHGPNRSKPLGSHHGGLCQHASSALVAKRFKSLWL